MPNRVIREACLEEVALQDSDPTGRWIPSETLRNLVDDLGFDANVMAWSYGETKAKA